MKILFDNVDFSSNSGPNGFGKKLASSLSRRHHILTSPSNEDVQLTFIQTRYGKRSPIVHRLDGIYFNSSQDWESLNIPIKRTYDMSDAVVYQSEFDKALAVKYFGERNNGYVIHNGTDLEAISKINPASIPEINEKYDVIWVCASQWRPHKRLNENIRYFQKHRGTKDCLLVAGELNAPAGSINDNLRDVYFLGNLSWEDLISVYKCAKTFIHLAFLDHCPNVVIDARACGCDIVVSSSGGTHEIAGPGATIMIEDSWDFEPMKLYEPPAMESSLYEINKKNSWIDITFVAKEYEKVLELMRR